MRSSLFSSRQSSVHPAQGPSKSTQGVTDFLRANDRIAALLPAVARNAALQKDCAAVLPVLFEACSVLHFDAAQLTVASPSSALAAKLKQQLPKLQDALTGRGWQVSVIRIKVQPSKISAKTPPAKQLVMPSSAVSALAELHHSLEDSPSNQDLKAALSTLLQRHQARR